MRQVEVFRPYTDEFPEHLLLAEGADDQCLTLWAEAEMLRVAKRGEEVLGAYAMVRLDTERFLLHGIVVAPPVRHQGLGRWLTGHAIGVAESKGGRYLELADTGGSRCFARMGFERAADSFHFAMIPE